MRPPTAIVKEEKLMNLEQTLEHMKSLDLGNASEHLKALHRENIRLLTIVVETDRRLR